MYDKGLKKFCIFQKCFAVFSREISQLFFAKWFSFIASERKAKCDFFSFKMRNFCETISPFRCRTSSIVYIFVSLSVNSSLRSQKPKITSRWNVAVQHKNWPIKKISFLHILRICRKKISENLFDFWCFVENSWNNICRRKIHKSYSPPPYF